MLVFERPLGPTVRAGVVVLAATGAVAAFVLLAPRGDVGLQGAGDTSVYQRLDAELGLPKDFDPTRFLALGQIAGPVHRGAFSESPGAIYHEYVRRAVGEERLRRPFLLIVPEMGLLAAFVLLRWGGPRLRLMAVAAATTAVVLFVVALAFDYRFDVYALAEFGPRRLFDYVALPAALLGAGVAEVALERLARRRASVATAVVLVGILTLAAVGVPRNVSSSSRERFYSTALAPLAWIEANVSCQGRVLVDRRTLGTLEAMTRHAGTIEGMGPYFRPAVLTTALRSLFAARDFFRDPSAGRDYLRANDVAAVVVTSPGQTLGGVGADLKVVTRDAGRVAGVPFLQLAASSATVKVYRVVGFEPPVPGTAPDVTRLPGYRCGG